MGKKNKGESRLLKANDPKNATRQLQRKPKGRPNIDISRWVDIFIQLLPLLIALAKALGVVE
jgi:hypothetical protein